MLASFYCAAGVDYSSKAELVKMLRDVPSVTKGAQQLYNGIYNVMSFITEKTTRFLGVSNPMANVIDQRFASFSAKATKLMSDKSATTIDCSEQGLHTLDLVITEGTELARMFKMANQTVLSQMTAIMVKN